MPASITFRGAELVPPEGVVEGDLSIHVGRIEAVGRVRTPRGEQVQARGLTLLPGVIDPQVHLRAPGTPHKEDPRRGSEGAGGVTASLEMPDTAPPTTSAAAPAHKVARATARALDLTDRHRPRSVMTVLGGRPLWREGASVEGVYGAPLRFAYTARRAGSEESP